MIDDGTGLDNAARVDEVFATWNRTGDDLHIEHDCTGSLCNRCCVRGWTQLRAIHPTLIRDAELLFGKDPWTTIPETLRTLLAIVAHSTAHTDGQRLAATERGLAQAAASVEEEKVWALKRSRKEGSR